MTMINKIYNGFIRHRKQLPCDVIILNSDITGIVGSIHIPTKIPNLDPIIAYYPDMANLNNELVIDVCTGNGIRDALLFDNKMIYDHICSITDYNKDTIISFYNGLISKGVLVSKFKRLNIGYQLPTYEVDDAYLGFVTHLDFDTLMWNDCYLPLYDIGYNGLLAIYSKLPNYIPHVSFMFGDPINPLNILVVDIHNGTILQDAIDVDDAIVNSLVDWITYNKSIFLDFWYNGMTKEWFDSTAVYGRFKNELNLHTL
jgi:hypothetical protein